MQSKLVRDRIVIADQPTRDEILALPEEGYAAVVNLRRDGEREQPLGTAEEGEEARSAGLAYLHEGVGGAPLTPEGVDAVCRFVDEQSANGKVLLHCLKGGRAAAMAVVYLARKEGWPPQEAVAKGQELGLNVEGNLKVMVELFLAQQAMQS
jgi:uncharacterized protein (TIGR01244 family)